MSKTILMVRDPHCFTIHQFSDNYFFNSNNCFSIIGISFQKEQLKVQYQIKTSHGNSKTGLFSFFSRMNVTFVMILTNFETEDEVGMFGEKVPTCPISPNKFSWERY